MIKRWPLLLFLCGLATLLAGQSADRPLVMRAGGTVRFQPVDQEPYRVYGGNYLTSDGELTIGEGGSVEIVYRERYKDLREAGTYRLDQVFEDVPPPTGLMSRFFNFISKGLDQSQSRQTLEKAYLENQGNAQGNTRGLGDGGLVGVRPFGGKLSADTYVFTWPRYPDATYYAFSIRDVESGDFIVTAAVSDTAYAVGLSGLFLQDGQTYEWQCRAVAQPTTSTSLLRTSAPTIELVTIEFTYTDEQAYAILAAENALPGFSPFLVEMSDARLLEEAGYLTAAEERYRLILREDDNPALRRLYASFLARWNLRQEANQLLRR